MRDPIALDRKLSRIRWAHRGGWIGLLVILLSIVLDRSGAFGYRGNDHQKYDKSKVTVVRVGDGDTVTIKADSSEEHVRLIGIDAPELSDQSYWAERSKRYLVARAEGKNLILRLEPTSTRDGYGRLLAYLFTEGAENLNESMIRDGQAYADRRHRHTYRGQFEAAENEARRKERGLWDEVKESQMPEWRQRWIAERRDEH